MAINLNDNIYVRAGKPIEYKYGPYSSVNEANLAIPIEERYHGLTFGVYETPNDIANSDILIYYYNKGLTNDDVKLFVNYVHPLYSPYNLTLSGSTVIDSIITDNIGSVVSISLRNLTSSDINLNDGILTLNTSGIGISGSQTFSANQSNDVTFTVNSNATSNNLPSTIVSRDESGNFNANIIFASLSGNSTTATKLETIRTINGTDFDGSENIITSYWGVSRDITIGNELKSVNGTQNLIWTLSEIGAQPINNNLTLIGNLNGTGLLRKIGIDDWVFDTNTYITENENIVLSGDITGSGNTSIVTTISNNVVTYSKIQQVTANRLLGRLDTNGNIQELTDSDVRSFINVEDNANNYIHPSYTERDITLTGATVIESFQSDDIGSIVNITTRLLTNDDINAVPKNRLITIQGTTNQIIVSNPNIQDLTTNVNWTLSLPQDIHNLASPTFSGLFVNGNIEIEVTNTATNTTHIPVFISDPENTKQPLYTKTPSELLNDMGGLPLSGGTMSGFITLHSDPTQPFHAATKKYVDSVAERLHIHPSVQVATNDSLSNLSSGIVTYDNGINGVGSTLTLSNQLLSIDGYTLENGDRILVKNETNKAHNGLYVRTSPNLLTRATDQDTSLETQSGDFVFVSNGNIYAKTGWVQILTVDIIGTDPLDWEQFSGVGTYVGSNSIFLNVNSFERAELTGDILADQNSNITTINTNAVTNSKFRQSFGLSVVGRSLNTTGNIDDIIASSDHQVLRRSGTTLGFGSINLSSPNAVTNILPITNGGTNSSTSLVNNRIMVSLLGSIVESSEITPNRALISDLNGIPTHSNITNIELNYLSGVTSSIQNQINNKQDTLTNPVTGTGTINYIPKFINNTLIGDSNIVSNGSNVGINTPNPITPFHLKSGNGTTIDSMGMITFFEANRARFVYGSTVDSDSKVAFGSGWGTIDDFVVHTKTSGNFSENTQRLTVKMNGNVLIGLIVDNGNRLQVDGNVSATTFIGDLSGNSSTATTLQTSRTINGTLFNGSSNIITSYWGTSRDITIGNTTKSIDGSINISWSISDIGAEPAFNKNTAFNKNFGTIADTVAEGNDSRFHNQVTIGTANGLSLNEQVLSLELSSTNTTGALSSTDWNTFNNKQDTLTNPVTGTGTINYIPKYSNTSEITNSQIFDNGTNIGFGTTTPSGFVNIYNDSVSGSTLFNVEGSQGQLFSITDDLSGSLFSVNDISGIPILEVFADDTIKMGTFGDEAITINGSNAGFGIENPTEKIHVIGNIKLNNILFSNQENIDVDTGTQIVATIPILEYDGAFFDYVIKNGTNLRAGIVYVAHDGTNVQFTETSTQDIGDTSDVSLSVDISGNDLRLIATTLSDNWIIKTLIRGL